MKKLLFLFAIAFFYQCKSDLSNFEIYVKKTENEIELRCEQGCDWKTLSFDASQPAYVGKAGMLESTENSSGMLLQVTHEGKTFKLKGLKGTAWKDLEFEVNNFVEKGIDENGMI